jgi:hypothetical protein
VALRELAGSVAVWGNGSHGRTSAELFFIQNDLTTADAAGGLLMRKKKQKKMRGSVQKVIQPLIPGEPERAQIGIDEADHLYREIRVENVVTDEKGEKGSLKPGAEVDVILEADADATTKKEADPK